MSSEEQAPSGGRVRRTRKKVDYSAEQQFSDEEDIFEDKDDEEKALPSSKRKNRARKSTGTGVVTTSVMDTGMTFERAKPVYTEKGYDPSLLPIRERFTFEPEFEDDGTPKIELIVGRRLIEDTKDRQTGDGRATADSDDESEDDESDDSGSPARRSRSKSKAKAIKKKPSSDDEEGGAKVTQSEMDYEYLLKYKGRSYLHLEWKTAADLESMNKSAKTTYRRFLKKLEMGTEEDLEDPTVDPAFTEPGRILAEEDHEIMVELSDKELVKWQKEQSKLEEMDEESEEEEEKKDTIPALDECPDKKEEEKKEKVAVGKQHSAPYLLLLSKLLTRLLFQLHFNKPEIKEPSEMTIDDLRLVVKNEEPYYPSYPGSDNPYRDGYFTEVSNPCVAYYYSTLLFVLDAHHHTFLSKASQKTTSVLPILPRNLS